MILDSYGNPASSTRRFNRSANNNTKDRPWAPTRLEDIGKMIRPSERKTLVAVSRLLVENWAPAKAITRQIAMYSVGKAWMPSLDAKGAAKDKARKVMREQFCPIADIQGRDFNSLLYHLTHLRLRDGEAFYLLTEWKTGFPAIQIVPSHRIGCRQDYSTFNRIMKVEAGPYKGLDIEDGVITNKSGAPVAYRFLADDPNDDKDISARVLKHTFDSDYPEGKRGYPSGAHALNAGRDSLQSHEWETLNMLARSSHTMLEWNESGVPDDDPNGYFDDAGNCENPTGNEKIETNTMLGGTWKTFKAGTGSKLQALMHETPGEVWESYNDRLEWSYAAGIPWPLGFIKTSRKGQNSVSEHKDAMLANQTIEDEQCAIEKDAKTIMGYAYQKMVQLGKVSATPDWWRWSFNRPPKLNIHDSKYTKSQLDKHSRGIVSDDDMLADMSREPEEFWMNKFESAARKELAFVAAQEKFKVTLDPRVKGMFTPNDKGDEENDDSQPDKKDEDSTDN